MPFILKIDALPALKDAGYSTYRLRKEKILSESTIQGLRQGRILSLSALEVLCQILNKQPNELIEYVPDEK